MTTQSEHSRGCGRTSFAHAIERQGAGRRFVRFNSTGFPPTASASSLMSPLLKRLSSLLLIAVLCGGCKSTPPTGSPIQPNPLGTIVDEANRIQEQNAEQAKFIVYLHEFELNAPKKKVSNRWPAPTKESQTVPREPDETELRGFRLNEYGLEHVRRIAQMLLEVEAENRTDVLVERSESSKRWHTLHHYPVHFNERLDEERRRVVVAALEAYGVVAVDSSVKVAAAFPEGLHSLEAVQAYQATRFGSRNGGGGGFGGGF